MIIISPQVSQGLEYIFKSDINHYDRRASIRALTLADYHEAALWVKNHEQEYLIGLYAGFHVEKTDA